MNYPVLYPIGALTFAIACSHCKNIGSDKCEACKCEIKSGFELKRRITMINKMIEDTMSQNPNTLSIYRHFKGGYYVVQSLATIESTGEEVVIYQSLQDGRVWVRPLSVFCELVPEDKENPTGQKFRFERVTSFNNQLKMISTEGLVKELLSRSDCPVEFMTPTNSDKVWREEYLVGRYDRSFIDAKNTVEDFDILSIFEKLERAVLFARAVPGMSILKRVFIKQDFD